MAKRTIDEKIILQVLEIAKKTGDPQSAVSIEKVSEKLKITPRQEDNIIKTLKRTGFLKQYEETSIGLTPKGIKLAEELLS